MNVDDVRQLVSSDAPSLRAEGVTALYVFGSVARGEAGDESDVDVIVDYDPSSAFNLIALAGVQRRLSETLARPVDVVTREGLHRRICSEVLEQAVRIF